MQPLHQKRLARSVSWRVQTYECAPLTPFPLCFTKHALIKILRTVGHRQPETGAMLFTPYLQFGVSAVEFDKRGSSHATQAVYRPDVAWAEKRRQYHLRGHDMRLWAGSVHSHPGMMGRPSQRSGPGLGDLGYVEEVFRCNQHMQWFILPILTNTGHEPVILYPWICKRAKPLQLYMASVKICPPSDFPTHEFNPEWEQHIKVRA